VQLVALAHDQDHPVVTITPPRREELEEAAEVPEAEVPTTAQREEGAEGGD
jgi:hypothetical protein